MHLFNYYYLQWHTDTNNLWKFTNLHDLSAFGIHPHYTHGTNTTLGLSLQKCVNLLSKHLRTPRSQSRSFLKLQLKCPDYPEPSWKLVHSLSSLLSLAQPYFQVVQHRLFFCDYAPKTAVLVRPCGKLFKNSRRSFRYHCRIFSKFHKDNQRQEEERKTFGCANAVTTWRSSPAL